MLLSLSSVALLRLQTRGGKKSGEARRAKTAERDTAIIQAIQAGQSMRAVGRVYGLDESSVRHIVKRGCGMKPKQDDVPGLLFFVLEMGRK